MNAKIKFLIKCIVAVGFVFLLNYCFSVDYNATTRMMMNELESDGKIDVLFLGTSHTQGGYNVNLIEEKTGLNVFNCGSDGQPIQVSYYLLKYANENNGVKKVWLDLSYNEMNDTEPNKNAVYLIADYFGDKKFKYEYLFTTFGVEGVINGVLPCLHNSNVGIKAMKAHISGDYKKEPYKYLIAKYREYAGQGFIYYKYSAASSDFSYKDSVYLEPDNLVSDYVMEYLNKIIEYCNDNDIELLLFNAPVTDASLIEAGDYQAFIDCANGVAEANGLEYLDFSLTKEEALTLELSDYKDYGHLNGQGAAKFSECVSKILNGELDKSAFYDTFAEKLANNPDGTAK